MSISNFGTPSLAPPPGHPPVLGPVPLGLIVPSINVLGAYFPDWLFCIVGALLLTIPIRLVLAPTSWHRNLERPIRLALYPSLSLLMALLGWVIFFKS
jgi:hypothetical protein